MQNTVLCAVVLTQYRRVTDRQTDGRTDGITVASTALAMRRAIKTHFCLTNTRMLSMWSTANVSGRARVVGMLGRLHLLLLTFASMNKYAGVEHGWSGELVR